jgi:hypothetical protein
MTSTATDRFAELARDYCQWAEGPVASPEIEAKTASRHLARLCSAALDLPATVDWSLAPEGVSQDQWRVVFTRFGALPVNYYSVCFDPTKVPSEEPVVGDLADDLADIWRDLKGGLMLQEAGNPDAAATHWHQTFSVHWGRHAASALYVLQCWTGLQ